MRTMLTTLVLIAMLAGPAWAAPEPTAYNVSWWIYRPCCLPGHDCDPTDPTLWDTTVWTGLGLGVFTERDDGLQELRISAVGGSPNNTAQTAPAFGTEAIISQGPGDTAALLGRSVRGVGGTIGDPVDTEHLQARRARPPDLRFVVRAPCATSVRSSWSGRRRTWVPTSRRPAAARRSRGPHR